jgi:hypothetical protein
MSSEHLGPAQARRSARSDAVDQEDGWGIPRASGEPGSNLLTIESHEPVGLEPCPVDGGNWLGERRLQSPGKPVLDRQGREEPERQQHAQKQQPELESSPDSLPRQMIRDDRSFIEHLPTSK